MNNTTKILFGFVLIVIVSSCGIFKKSKPDKCKVDFSNLIIQGDDIDMQDSITFYGSIQFGIYFLMDHSKKSHQRYRFSKGFKNRDYIRYKICHCQDTVWAKNRMLEILKARYNPKFRYVDSTEHQLWFSFELIDSTKLSPPLDPMNLEDNYRINSVVGYVFENAPLHMLYTVVFENIERCYIDEKTEMRLDRDKLINIDRRFDHIIKDYDSAPPEYPTMESYIKHVRDQHGIEVTITKDTIVPYRWLYIYE